MKIVKVTPFLLSSNYGSGKVLGQPMGAKTLGFVRIETSEGIVGHGEAYCAIYAPESFLEVIRIFSNELLGEDALNPEFLYDRIHIPFVTRSGFFRSAYSAIDIALWDIKSKYEKKTIAELITTDQPKKSIKVYASGGSAAFSPKEIEEDLNNQISLGHSSYKMRVGFQSWENDLKRMETARNILGNSRELMVDAIMGTINPPWTIEIAKKQLKQAEEFNLTWIEEPLAPDNLLDYKELKKHISIPIAGGEALSSKLDFESYISNQSVDYLQPDVTHCGGITAAKRICKLAGDYKIKISMHVWGSPLAFAANKEIALGFENVQWLEEPTVSLDLSNDFVTAKSITDGRLTTTDELGLPFPNFNDILNKYPYIPGSGFKFPNRKN
ncbi:mandelate racemase/muconate lactonizing enzyme family protein [Leptospira sp. 201903071]|uniref:mandelate racemase/muconate lactonizing enzyme family protein n=1 Tax=Leptospira ainazelensis TaxID=2810034 RepID=UPI0019669D09|nr:mandelate racemase/muconate lactonizing enzyme family protein [Leptospira ainazelensis]MBM9501935.1 mandelate racemase/muconate lactonizing enzyme family protein [Leptospira ainazelensis]